MSTNHKIIIGDSRCMKELRDESMHLIITSPPYWQLKDYGDKRQIGYDHTYEEYINNLNLVWNECHRVLHPGCRLCINIGDQFARSVYYGRYKIIPIRTEIIRFCETTGFDYMGAIIWQKITTCNTTGGATIMGSFPYPRNGIVKLDYEFILLLKKRGNAPKVAREIKERSRLTQEEWNSYFTGHWNFPGERQDKHLAVFPEELPKRLIKMFSFVGDTVLDPFLGSGTTSVAARNLSRNSVGYEINESFLPIISDRLRLQQRDFLDNSTFQIQKQEEQRTDFTEEIQALPCVFKDPVRFDKKVDPKKLRFGSRIDSSPARRETYYRVEKVISPERLILDNGLQVRLLGIKQSIEKSEEAAKYLEQWVKGKRVFLKFDEKKHDDESNLLCYLYLENRTLINAHLIRKELVLVDESYDYSHRRRFLSYEKNGRKR
jgi:DNA modification methylase